MLRMLQQRKRPRDPRAQIGAQGNTTFRGFVMFRYLAKPVFWRLYEARSSQHA